MRQCFCACSPVEGTGRIRARRDFRSGDSGRRRWAAGDRTLCLGYTVGGWAGTRDKTNHQHVETRSRYAVSIGIRSPLSLTANPLV